jgi:uncharacterized repeat protein (TIGR03803 family)
MVLSSSLTKILTTATLALMLVSGAWARTKFKVLHAVGGGLFSGMALDAKGNLYGATNGGGDHGDGSIFELSKNSRGTWILTTLHSFTGDGGDGAYPNGNLMFDSKGNMYGTTQAGGPPFYGGTVFEMSPGSGGWTLNLLYSFCAQYHCPDGGGSESGLVFDKAGNLYGTTAGGGDQEYGGGVVFELAPQSSGGWDESGLYKFGSWNGDGSEPYGAPTFDRAGDIYGTTALGGSYREGTVFRLQDSAAGWKETVLWQFGADGSKGLNPTRSVVFGNDGSLYSTTQSGGSKACPGGCGTIFKLTFDSAAGWKETVLYDFPKPEDGSTPTSGLIFDKAGNLYGTTGGGGNTQCGGGCGVVYKLVPGAGGTWRYAVVHKFRGTDGGYPDGGLVFDAKGNLYGTAYTVVYEISP